MTIGLAATQGCQIQNDRNSARQIPEGFLWTEKLYLLATKCRFGDDIVQSGFLYRRFYVPKLWVQGERGGPELNKCRDRVCNDTNG
jgi:hypothetical protein